MCGRLLAGGMCEVRNARATPLKFENPAYVVFLGCAMTNHKYKSGQTVHLISFRADNAPGGTYVVIKRMGQSTMANMNIR